MSSKVLQYKNLIIKFNKYISPLQLRIIKPRIRWTRNK